MLITPFRIVLLLCLGLVMVGLMMWRFDFAWQGIAASIFIIMLVVLSIIDLYIQLLPDWLTQPLLWLGLLVNLKGAFVPLSDAVIGAVTGYMLLWLLAKIYLFWRGQEGIGHGDFKLAAVLGAWLGYKILLTETLVLALLGGGLTGLIMIAIFLFRRKYRAMVQTHSLINLLHTAIPFGPFLAAAGIWSILFSINW
jgi:leader peptidase (prepilin peptidase)/N-methyltransferase